MRIYSILIGLYILAGIGETKDSDQHFSKPLSLFRSMAASDTMTVLLSKTDHYYYYQGKLEDDAVNFKAGNPRIIKEAALIYDREAGAGGFVIVIKTDRKPKLKEDAKELVSFLQQKYKCMNGYFTAEENNLISLVEKNLAD